MVTPMLTTEEILRLSVGPDLDAVVAELRGEHLPPSKEYAMAKVGWRYVAVTGNPFTLRTGERVTMPPGEGLRQPKGSNDWNDRYGLFVAHYLLDSIKVEVDAYRMPAKAYSTDWQHAGPLLLEMGFPTLRRRESDGKWECTAPGFSGVLAENAKECAAKAWCLWKLQEGATE